MPAVQSAPCSQHLKAGHNTKRQSSKQWLQGKKSASSVILPRGALSLMHQRGNTIANYYSTHLPTHTRRAAEWYSVECSTETMASTGTHLQMVYCRLQARGGAQQDKAVSVVIGICFSLSLLSTSPAHSLPCPALPPKTRPRDRRNTKGSPLLSRSCAGWLAGLACCT